MKLPKGADPEAYAAAMELVAAGKLDELVALADRGKSARKAVAAAVDGPTARALAALGGGSPDDAPERLLRRARRVDAQVRRNPIKRNEGFTCARCGESVSPAPGGSVRNHCPRCLCSLHVDGPVPGDRASDCGGVMQPVDAVFVDGRWRVRQRCVRCGAERNNRVFPEWDVQPDRLDALPRADD